MAQKSFLIENILTFIVFGWAIHRYFRSRKRALPLKMKVLQGLGLVAEGAVTYSVYRYPATTLQISVAMIVNFIAYVLFGWAVEANFENPLPVAFSNLNSVQLVTRGPYRWMRNPIYTSYILFWMAGILGTSLWLPIPVILGLYFLYWMAATEEEVSLEQQFGATYLEYKSRVGRFFPRIFRGRPNSKKEAA